MDTVKARVEGSRLLQASPTMPLSVQRQVSLPHQPRLYEGSHCISHMNTTANCRARAKGPSITSQPGLGLGCTWEVDHLPGTTCPCQRHWSLPSGVGSAPSWKRGLEVRVCPCKKHGAGGVPCTVTPQLPQDTPGCTCPPSLFVPGPLSVITPGSDLTQCS